MRERSTSNILYWMVIFTLVITAKGCGTTQGTAPIKDYSPAPDISTSSDKTQKKSVGKKQSTSKKINASGESIKAGQYRVKAGDTLYSISIQFGVDHKELANFNGIDDTNVIHVGQILKIPKTTAKAKVEPKPDIRSQDPPPLASSGLGTWRWPVNGSLKYRYMERVSERGKGVGIEVNKETAVFAAAPGKVVYSGSGLRGYGKLLIIKHNESFLSVYAHNSQLLSSEGQFIAQGQQIAIIGAENQSSVLHFEVRRKGKPVDPLKYLPKR